MMLTDIDLSRTMNKETYKRLMASMGIRLGELQREARELKVPILILFEGWDAAGKGTSIGRLIQALDPRGFNVYTNTALTDDERYRPFFWWYWIKSPAAGRIVFFDQGWYGRILDGWMNGNDSQDLAAKRFREAAGFERLLSEGGTIILKFFLHIGKKEQRKRFERLLGNPATSWRVGKKDLKQQKKHKDWEKAFDRMIEDTDTDFAPWHIIEAEDDEFSVSKIYSILIDTLERRLGSVKLSQAARMMAGPDAKPEGATQTQADSAEDADTEAIHSSVLDTVDLSVSIDRETYERELDACRKKLAELEHEIYKRRIPVVILYEGWDAAGKGGNIKRLTSSLDPRGYEVVPVSAPNDIEKAHHYLWRFWCKIPKAGHITIFDRTWYGRVLVERIEGFCGEADWRKAYREINEFERELTGFGSVLVKFWLHIDKETQGVRFAERQKIEHKQWKITEEDLRNRSKWDLYRRAVDDMLLKTSTSYAPWTVVEANCKYFARVKAMKTVIEAIESAL